MAAASVMCDKVAFVIVHPKICVLSTLDFSISIELLLDDVSTGSVIIKSPYENFISFVIFRIG